MSTINEAIERVQRAQPDELDDATKAMWIIGLDGRLRKDFIDRHERTEELPGAVTAYPEDADKPLLIPPPYEHVYDLYLMAQILLYQGEYDRYANAAVEFNTALNDWKKFYHRTHRPLW